ncbi:MAG: cation diffusion facilitator family transporter [Candidatus Cyclobacteriaceae bacterium M2_1C_046]
MAHDHHHHADKSGKNLKLAFFLNFGFAILELIGGLFVNSVAILSDALHDLGDSFSLGLAWFLNKKSKKEASERYTFGYERFSLLGALINSVILIIGSVFIISEAIARISAPESVNATGMIIFALFGVAMNGYAAYKLHGGESLNEEVVRLHLLEDVMGWVAVLIGAIVIKFTGFIIIDPILSILIAGYILFNVFKRLKKTLHIFLQGVPEGVDIEEVKNKLQRINKVESLHHTHVWSLDGQRHVFSTHLKLKEVADFNEIMKVKAKAKEILDNYNFDHYTVETELSEESCQILQKSKNKK